jgi:PHP family Zn ribbon phosphoesterase
MSQTLCLVIRKVIKQTVVITGPYHCHQPHTQFYHTFCCQG